MIYIHYILFVNNLIVCIKKQPIGCLFGRDLRLRILLVFGDALPLILLTLYGQNVQNDF